MKQPSNTRPNLLVRIAPFALLLLAVVSLPTQPPQSVVLSGTAEAPPVVTSASGTGEINRR